MQPRVPEDPELKSFGSQPGKHSRAPERSWGISLGEAMRAWGLSSDGIYAAELRGQLHGLRIGNRVWYSVAELVDLFGSPTHPPSRNGVKKGESAKGG